ncbi:c-type cytochrome [Vibrio sp. S4M6]|uniref:c-type cytochrome n=1 Tax=Vibrio sinus TaxID=2946865 RepID=UPI00202A84F6|nr:c-type cytochrome [Vibrio sinus]MCL9781600.1 c-type cytochrome [Vibrio sinus]
MNVLWHLWALGLTILFFFLMIGVVIKYWRSNHRANENTVIDTFDGIEERDAPVPKLLFISYLISFILSAGYLVLYPGLAGWPGLLDWKQSNDKLSDPTTTLQAQMSVISDRSLVNLASDDLIVTSGQILFQTHCAACHRSNAQGQENFPNLIDHDWLWGGSDEDILDTINNGREGVMPSWKAVFTPEQIEELAYFILAKGNRDIDAPAVKIQIGQSIFEENCIKCHWDGKPENKNNEDINAPNLFDSVWLHGGSVEDIQYSITNGWISIMPSFQGKLSEDEVLAIGAFITRARLDNDAKLAKLNSSSVQRGKYLARAGDCVACHSAIGGEPFAGGLPFVTPFGTLYSTNITPHIDEGIGSYNYDEFRAALVDGKGKHGYLYPAMPYTSYQYINDKDIRALWDYLQTIVAVPRRDDKNDMMFPSNVRLGLLGWNLVFMDTAPLDYQVPNELAKQVDDVEKWQRGKYLAMGLGHCSECHTPRNFAQALESDRLFHGNLIDGWNAPAIDANELYIDGWDLKSLTDFLKTGNSGKGTAFAGMADVVKNSLQYMTLDDIESIAYYLLKGDKGNLINANAVKLSPSGFTDSAYQTADYKLFSETCGACHGQDGKGRNSIAPTLLHNGIIMHSDPYNTIAVTIRGLSPSYIDERRNFMSMVSFSEIFSDEKLAQLISFVRKYLGDRHEPVTRADVKKVRLQLEKAGFTGGLHTTPDMFIHRDKNIDIE